MSEKRYLLTQDEICRLQYIALSSLAWGDDDNDEMVELKQADYRAMLESHEYRERTCRAVSHSVFCGSFGCEEAGERWELSCGHEALTEYDRPGYCPECGARLVEP